MHRHGPCSLEERLKVTVEEVSMADTFATCQVVTCQLYADHHAKVYRLWHHGNTYHQTGEYVLQRRRLFVITKARSSHSLVEEEKPGLDQTEKTNYRPITNSSLEDTRETGIPSLAASDVKFHEFFRCEIFQKISWCFFRAYCAGCVVHCNKVSKPVKGTYLLLCMNSTMYFLLTSYRPTLIAFLSFKSFYNEN